MNAPEHPWRGIDLGVYERHMSDARVGQLQQLRTITGDQLFDHPATTVGFLGVAGGNGLDLIGPAVTTVYGYDINPDYLAACEDRYRDKLGERLHVIEATIDRALQIAPVDLLIANLIVEYVGASEFAAFIAANADGIGVLSCVIQRNEAASFVSTSDVASAFDGLASVASDVDAGGLAKALANVGWLEQARWIYSLPNGKTLIRQDFVRQAAQAVANRG